MTMTDPIADMLTRIRNANAAAHKTLTCPSSKTKKAILDILVEEGYIIGYDLQDDNKQGILTIKLKYAKDGTKVISGLKRISKPGLRVYTKKDDIPKVLGGLGIAIISTSQGMVTDKVARKVNSGGEVICYVW